MVYTLRVVEEKPVHELLVKTIHVQKQCIVVVDEVFLDGAIESLDVGVHLRRLRIGVVVGDLEFEKTGSEVLLELASVVSENEGGAVWKDLYPTFKELLRCLGGM